MSSYEELVAAVRAALPTVAASETLAVQGREHLVEATGRIESIARGSASWQLGDSLDALAAGIAAAERAEAAAARAVEQFNAYLSDIGGGSGGQPSQAEPSTSPIAPVRASSTPQTPDGKIDYRQLARRAGITNEVIAQRDTLVPDFQPGKQNPACWQGLAPRQEGGSVKGNLFFPDGRKWNDVLVESGRGRSAFDVWQLKPEFRDFTPALGHLEGNVAAWMIENQERSMVLYINEHPCDNEGKGCLPKLKHFLPKGFELRVWSRSAKRVWKQHIFRGTGEAFQPRS